MVKATNKKVKCNKKEESIASSQVASTSSLIPSVNLDRELENVNEETRSLIIILMTKIQSVITETLKEKNKHIEELENKLNRFEQENREMSKQIKQNEESIQQMKQEKLKKCFCVGRSGDSQSDS